ncbi:GFA family protein [Pseudomonas syringae]|uniref:GFA family protein n=1 Tax=Pseudomonas syringae TaxID=317 RepID=UPI0009AF7B61|nr:GFA family protein [Pseudomonas syringae]MDY2563988.1 GFA family protein [Pseudomonas syringae]
MDTSDGMLQGTCHCGAVRFQVRLTDGFKTVRRCNCSYCRMRGAIAVSAALEDIEITSGEAMLKLYQFNTLQAKHYFCSQCGIYTHHQRRSNPAQYGVNVACLEGISPFDFELVPVNEGRIHPADKAAGSGSDIAGYLRYIPTTTTS